ncbi:phage holin family protein [Paenibacillus sp. sgz302251]|uniref:phage holin family protein n=1 Tax=Paenibacillus sp. sgz302251 TaxID=3414493 RepID=UPI003C7A1033
MITQLKILTAKEAGLYGVSAFFGSIFTYALGGMTPLLHFMFICMAIDYLSGCAASIIEGKGLSSSVGFKGLSKKCFIILSLWLANYADQAIGVDWIMIGVIWFWIANELVSLAENYARMGLPFPEPLKKVIAIVKDRGEKQ